MTLMSFCEAFGTVVGAIAGTTASSRVRMDLFGVVTCGTICALGGGTVRDILLGPNVPVYWVVESGVHFLYFALATSFLMFFATRFWTLPLGTVRIADAFSLALFTMIGTEKAMGTGASPTVSIIMGITTGVAGGVLRDLATGNVPYVFRPGELYATAAFIGSGGYFLLLQFGCNARYAYVIGIFVVFAVRMAAVWWNWRLPSYRPLFKASTSSWEEREDGEE